MPSTSMDNFLSDFCSRQQTTQTQIITQHFPTAKAAELKLHKMDQLLGSDRSHYHTNL